MNRRLPKIASSPRHRTWSRLRRLRSDGALLVVAFCAACPESPRGRDATPPVEAREPYEVAESIYDSGLKNGWQDSGTAKRELGGVGPARVQFNVSGEWILGRPGLDGKFEAVVFRIQEPPGEGEFLEVALASKDALPMRGVKLKPDHRTLRDDGWTQVILPMSELDPQGKPFDRIVFRPFRPFGSDWVLFDQIALAKGTGQVAAASGSIAAAAAASPGAKAVRTRVECDGAPSRISPFIYGIAFGEAGWEKLGATARRWGGNPKSRYNWEANCDNHASDWFFENATSAPSYAQFLAESAAHGVASAMTIPMLGWVARDGTSYSFPVSAFGPQGKIDPSRPDVGDGSDPARKPLVPGPATRTSVPAPPEWAGRWVSAIRAADASTGKRAVYEYILDNEPALWSVTHRDVHPDPVSYDELLDRTLRYAAAIRSADPKALIAGPAEWGWSGYFYSAKDLVTGHADRMAHGDVPLVEWYLRKLSEHERQTGSRVIDVFDLHYYPQESGVYGEAADRQTQLLRLRSTRSLWDDSYVDESWIKTAVRLLPRMREWVDKNAPGLGLSIGEWNFGGEHDITGALATAEALGRFAQFGVTSAFYWLAPPTGSASTYGFLAYRNFDGSGGHFLDWYVPTTRTEQVSFFASRDDSGKHLIVVAINLSPDTPVTADVDLSSCGSVSSYKTYAYARDTWGFNQRGSAAAGPVNAGLAPWSITVFDIGLQDVRKATAK